MRIKMITMECGPAGNFAPGVERTVSDEHGKQLIAAKAAVQLIDKAAPIEKAQAPAQETARQPAPEKTEAPQAETRGGKARK